MAGIAMANPNGEDAGNSCAFSPICWDEDGYCADFDMDAIRAYRERE